MSPDASRLLAADDDKPAVKSTYQVGGAKCPKSKLSKHDGLTVTVSDPTVHDDGFFSAKYATFQVQTNELKLCVRRRDKDFALLYDYFCKVCPYVLVPTVPELKKNAKLDPKTLDRRAAQLETFLNQCLRCEELRLFPVFLDFLEYPDVKAFSKQVKAAADKAVKATCTKEFYTPSGFHTINANKHIVNFANNLSVYLNVLETCCTKFHDLSRRLAEQLQATSQTLAELAECAQYCSKTYTLCGNRHYSQLCAEVEAMFSKWSQVQSDYHKA